MNAPRKSPVSSDHSAALEQYRRRAGFYDLELMLFEPVRRDAVARLALRRGDVVLDVGCGTGLSLPLLHQAVGPQGHIVGIEQCPEMLAHARQKVAQHGWKNITLIEAQAETAPIEAAHAAASSHRAGANSPGVTGADAALFHFTHDILREPRALIHIVKHLRPGAGVVASGLQWVSPWLWPVNVFVMSAAMHSVTSLNGLSKPWSHLESLVDLRSVESQMMGAVFVASGVVPARRRRAAHDTTW